MPTSRILSLLGIIDVVTVPPEATVEQALHMLDDRGLRAAPVVDKDNIFLGMFSTHDVIRSLVPSYMTAGMASLDFAVGASPVLADRLRQQFPSRVGDHVSADNCMKIMSQTHTWEALRLLAEYGSPLPVVERDTGRLLGLISEQSAIEALLKLEAKDAESDAG